MVTFKCSSCCLCSDLCERGQNQFRTPGQATFCTKCEAGAGFVCCIVFGTKSFAHFLQHFKRGVYPCALLFCCFIFILSVATFLLFWAQLMVQKVNWALAELRSCQLPTTKEVADPAQSFSPACCSSDRERRVWHITATSSAHKICLIKIFVKICKLFCFVGSLATSSNSDSAQVGRLLILCHISVLSK